MTAVYKALKEVVKNEIILSLDPSISDYMVRVTYKDGSVRTLLPAQAIYEPHIGRELMPHEFVRKIDTRDSKYELLNLQLMVRHPDWPEVDEEPTPALPLLKEYRTETEIHPFNHRKSIRIFTAIGVSKRTSWSRYVFEKAIGRLLTTKETVDHIDEDRFNDEVSNLQVLSLRKNVQKNKKVRGMRVGDEQYSDYRCDLPECGNTFTRLIKRTKRSQHNFCSTSCGSIFNGRIQHAHLEQTVSMPCGCCGKLIEVEGKKYRHQIKKGKRHYYCNNQCRIKSGNHVRLSTREYATYNCSQCGKELTREVKVVENKNRGKKIGIFCGSSCSAKFINKHIMKYKMKDDV